MGDLLKPDFINNTDLTQSLKKKMSSVHKDNYSLPTIKYLFVQVFSPGFEIQRQEDDLKETRKVWWHGEAGVVVLLQMGEKMTGTME